MASKKTAATGIIETGCFQYEIHYSATVDPIAMAELIVTDLRWQ